MINIASRKRHFFQKQYSCSQNMIRSPDRIRWVLWYIHPVCPMSSTLLYGRNLAYQAWHQRYMTGTPKSLQKRRFFYAQAAADILCHCNNLWRYPNRHGGIPSITLRLLAITTGISYTHPTPLTAYRAWVQHKSQKPPRTGCFCGLGWGWSRVSKVLLVVLHSILCSRS